MKPRIRLLIVGMTLGTLALTACAPRMGPSEPLPETLKQERPEKMPRDSSKAFKPGELLVRFNASAEPARLEDIWTQAGLSLLHRFHSPGLYLFSIQDGTGVMEKRTEMEAHPLVVYAEPNFIYTLDDTKKTQNRVPGELLVRFAPHTEKARIDGILAELDLEMVEAFALPGLYRVKTSDAAIPVENIVQQLNAFPEVHYAEPNYIFSITPNQ